MAIIDLKRYISFMVKMLKRESINVKRLFLWYKNQDEICSAFKYSAWSC